MDRIMGRLSSCNERQRFLHSRPRFMGKGNWK